MATLLERSIRSVEERLLLLAPPTRVVPAAFTQTTDRPYEHARRVKEVQRLRGDIYFTDGAVRRQDLSLDGRHQTPEDDKSWHLVMLNECNEINACTWYLEHPNTVHPDKLRISDCPAGMRKESKQTFWKAVCHEIGCARRENLGYAEVGGWAVSEENRCTPDGLVLALAAYSLGRMLGGALGLTTATVRHSSSTILRRLGGSPLEADGVPISTYYDPRYQCDMELLRFDSRRPNARYGDLVDLLTKKLAQVQVIGRSEVEVEHFEPMPTTLTPRTAHIAAA